MNKANIHCLCAFLGMLASLTLVSCVTTTPPKSDFAEEEQVTMNSWLGHSKQELILSWGPPTRVTSDYQDGEVLIYDRTVTLPAMPGHIQRTPFGSGLQYTNPMNLTITRSRMFYVNPQGKIYHWRAEGRQGY